MTNVSSQSVDSDIQRVIDGSTGRFRDNFVSTSYDLKKTILNSNTTSQGTVNSSGLDSISGTTGHILVAATSKVTNAAGALQDTRRLRLELQVEKIGDTYLVSNMEIVQ